MYLSELFLLCLDGNFSDNSVKNALILCETEYQTRKDNISNQEILDFFDVAREFEKDLKDFECELTNVLHLHKSCVA